MRRATCIDGPYAGQTFDVSTRDWHWFADDHWKHVGQLAWIINGPDKHCYQLVGEGWTSPRLIYRDTF